MHQDMHRVAALRERIKAVLEGERQRILKEIRAYPTPIPRCDEQFNQLIARRELLFAELARLDAAAGPSAAAGGGARLEAFVKSSACLDPDLKLQLDAALRGELDPAGHAG